MTEFHPGDMCVVTNGHPRMEAYPSLIGIHVIVLRRREILNERNSCEPYYDVSGGPPSGHLSHLVLRRIEPPPLDADEVEEDELQSIE